MEEEKVEIDRNLIGTVYHCKHKNIVLQMQTIIIKPKCPICGKEMEFGYYQDIGPFIAKNQLQILLID
jgi:transposase-like protein